MSYDLTDLEKWVVVPKGGGIWFSGSNPRQVRVEVLADQPTRLYVEHEHEGKPVTHFIGIVCGYEVIKFQMSSPFRLTADGVGAKVWSPEMLSAGAIELPEAVSFTTMMQRRERNPIVEQMMHKMQQNMERRIARAERDMQLRLNPERRIADIERSLDEFRRKSAAESASLVTVSDDDDGDAGDSEADAGDGDGPKKRGPKPRGSKVAAKPAA